MIIITNFRILWAWARCFYFVLFDKDELDYFMRMSWMFVFYVDVRMFLCYEDKLDVFLFEKDGLDVSIWCSVRPQESSDDRDRVAEPRQALFFKIFKFENWQINHKINFWYLTEKKSISILFPDILQDWVPVVYLLQVSSWRIRIRPNNADHSGFVMLINQCSTISVAGSICFFTWSVFFLPDPALERSRLSTFVKQNF